MTICPFTEGDLIRLLGPCLRKPFVFLETASFDKENTTSYLFTDFVKILKFGRDSDPDRFFEEINRLLKKGFWLCGYFEYEFGYRLEPALKHLAEDNGAPLVWLGVCKEPIVITHSDYRPDYKPNENLPYILKNLRPNIGRDEYRRRIKEIKHFIEDGLTYQVNFTFKIKFDFAGDILGLYLDLKRAQPASYMALINSGDSQILSLSPELFFRLKEGRAITRPMKGTAPRGLTDAEDKKNRAWLTKDRKIKAENLMIVDLMRNDLGRISEKVWVSKFFTPERYRTLYQLTSTVESKLKENTTIKEIFCSLFPSGSVTGAPKIKTMEIIKRLEKEPRGIYTGAIGYINKDNVCFNVSIRTLRIKADKGEMGIGGGIVYDSSEDKEYGEALLKARFLTRRYPDFYFIETILWQKDKGYYLLDLHLKRLKRSCDYFSVPLDLKTVKKELNDLAHTLKNNRFKVRLTVDVYGEIKVRAEPLDAIAEPVKVKISSKKINPADIFLYHKTSHRALYNREKKLSEKEGFFETIFFNTRGELAEGAISNIFILKDGKLLTPSVSCGLLEGVLREQLIREGKVQKATLYADDLKKADKVFIGNSVRGLLEAKIYGEPPET